MTFLPYFTTISSYPDFTTSEQKLECISSYFFKLKDNIDKYHFLSFISYHVESGKLKTSWVEKKLFFSLFKACVKSSFFCDRIKFDFGNTFAYIDYNKKIAKGGYGSIYNGLYKATHKTNSGTTYFHDDIVMKILHNSEDDLQQLLCGFKEIEILKSLSDSNYTSKYYESCLFFDNKGKINVAIFLKKLNTSWRKSGKLIMDVLCELFEALDFIQKRGICHNDLKDNNIVLGDDNRLKLIDFGVSFFYDTKTCSTSLLSSNLHANQIALSLPLLKSPVDNTKISHADKIDIWSLGILCGSLIFKQDQFNFDIFFENYTPKISTITKVVFLDSVLDHVKNTKDLNCFYPILNGCLNENPKDICSLSELESFLFEP